MRRCKSIRTLSYPLPIHRPEATKEGNSYKLAFCHANTLAVLSLSMNASERSANAIQRSGELWNADAQSCNNCPLQLCRTQYLYFEFCAAAK